MAPKGAAEPYWPQKGLQSPEEQQRNELRAGGEEPELRGCCVPSAERGPEQDSPPWNREMQEEFGAGMSLLEGQNQVPILCTPSAFLAAVGFYFHPGEVEQGLW